MTQQTAAMRTPTRRQLLTLLTTATAFLGLPVARAAIKTPAGAEGPFYPRPNMRVSDTDNDLVAIAGRVVQAGGDIVHVRGRITDTHGEPLSGARIEIWQCDVNGRYSHPGDRQNTERDSGFQGFGHDITDADGHYHFRTIKPVPYPGRTPHIHVKIWRGAQVLLTTQLYLKDHPSNARDGLYRRLSKAEADAVSMAFDTALAEPEAQVNITV